MASPSSNDLFAGQVLPAVPAFEVVCVPLAAATVDAFCSKVPALPVDLGFVELRLDALEDPGSAASALRSLQPSRADRRFLVTCRPRRSGGLYAGGAQEEFAVLLAAAQAGFPMVDLSLESAEELGADAVQRLQSLGAKVLVSFHDFAQTGDLEAVLARMRCLAPDMCKVVSTAQSMDDSLGVLAWLRDNQAGPSSRSLIALAMGEAGVLTRILGPRFGAPFTFAAAHDDEATAPGQLTARTMLDLFRLREITRATRLFGVAGDPIRSSLSPQMFNTVFREEAMDAVYLPLLTRDPETLFRAARELPLDGFSVTMPLKGSILPFLQHVDPLAARIGAVNTVLRTADGEFHGYNTDAEGVVAPLEQRLALRGARVLILGAGGAARAAAFGCADRGAVVAICNRTLSKAQQLAEAVGGTAVPHEALGSERFDVLIQATPAGMRGNPQPLPLLEHELRADLVFDLVYNPAETPLLAMARARGLDTIEGMEMFLHQGAKQFALWTGRPAPIASMRATVLQALKDR